MARNGCWCNGIVSGFLVIYGCGVPGSCDAVGRGGRQYRYGGSCTDAEGSAKAKGRDNIRIYRYT